MMVLASKLTSENKLKTYGRLVPLTEHIFPSKSQSTLAENLDIKANAHQLFDELPKHDVESATALISQLARQNQHRESIFCFLRMLHSSIIRPNEYTFGTTIHSSVVLRELNLGRELHAYATKVGLNCNVFVGSALSDLYAKLSSIDEALKAFQDTNNPNVVSYTTLIHVFIKEDRFDQAINIFQAMPERNVVSWNTMISGCSQTGKNEDAVNFFVEMLRQGIVPTQASFPCTVIAAANIGALGMGKSVHACAIKFLGSELGIYIANSLISFYSKCGSMEDSALAFDKTRMKNVVSWNALICGYAQNGLGKDAIETYQRMKRLNVRPNSVTLLGLLLACNHTGLVDEGYKYFNEARRDDDNGRILKPEHYACMIDLLSRSGRFHEAERFLRDLPFDPGVGFWKALLGGCRVHSNLGLGKIAAQKILELDPSDVSSYIMLSNAHSAAGRWETVLDIRQKMREKGLNRVPGSSWIEVSGKQVHVFVTGDEQHCNKKEIYVVLGCLTDHAMDVKDTVPLTEFWD